MRPHSLLTCNCKDRAACTQQQWALAACGRQSDVLSALQVEGRTWYGGGCDLTPGASFFVALQCLRLHLLPWQHIAASRTQHLQARHGSACL